MAERPEISGALREGEALGAPELPRRATRPCGTYAAAARHARRREPLCGPCAEARRTYHRERAQLAWSMAAFRRRENARTAARLAERRRVDPEWRARCNAKDRVRRQRAKRAARLDVLRGVDVVVVQRLIAGERVAHNRNERLEAVRQLRARGVAYLDIAVRLHVTPRQVHRDLTDLGLIHTAGEVA